ncbi:unnamed protein product, partial [Polarella glacialis]
MDASSRSRFHAPTTGQTQVGSRGPRVAVRAVGKSFVLEAAIVPTGSPFAVVVAVVAVVVAVVVVVVAVVVVVVVVAIIVGVVVVVVNSSHLQLVLEEVRPRNSS